MDEQAKKKLIAEYEAKAAEFRTLHPNYCTVCQGWGEVGSGVMDQDTGMIDRDVCSSCVEQGICPHCGSPIVESGSGVVVSWVCTVCGWSEGKDGIVLEPEFDDEIPDIDREYEEVANLSFRKEYPGLPPCPFRTDLDEWTG